MTHILTGKAGSHGITPGIIDSMLALRRETFADRLSWAVNVSGRHELDYYDVIAPTYVIATDELRQRCLGCLRLLPVSGPNMLTDIFAEELECPTLPVGRDVWDVSRFAVAQDLPRTGMHFSNVPADILRAMARLAYDSGVTQLVGVTSTPVTKLLSKLGFVVNRLGVEKMIGTTRTVAFSLPICDSTMHGLGLETRRNAA